jgi:tetratricopeptide (TPR) repeat protein
MPLIEKAIRIEPQNGLYYYGRGRIYLLSGDKDKALADFKKAAEFGDEDAIKYLEHISKSQS